MRSLPRGTLNAVKRGLVVLLTFLVINLYWTGHSTSSSTSTVFRAGSDGPGELPYPLPRTRLLRGKVPITQVLNHAPGFTVFKDVYYQRGRYIIVTDSPHEIPSHLDQIAYIEGRPDNVPEPIELIEVRRPPIMNNMPTDRDHYITPESALRRFDPANIEVIAGISVRAELPSCLLVSFESDNLAPPQILVLAVCQQRQEV